MKNKFHYRFHKISPLGLIRKEVNPLHIFTHPNSAQQSPFWETNNSQASQEIFSSLYKTKMLITTYTRARRLSLTLINPVHAPCSSS